MKLQKMRVKVRVHADDCDGRTHLAVTSYDLSGPSGRPGRKKSRYRPYHIHIMSEGREH